MWWLVKKRIAWAILLLLLLPQCGYNLRYRLKDRYVGENGVFVPVFDNFTDDVGVEMIFTNALIRELTSRREVVLTSRKPGVLEIKGTVVRVEKTPTVQSDPGFKGLQPYRRLPTEYGVKIVVRFEIRQTGSGALLMDKEFEGFRRVNAPLGRTYDYEAPSSLGMYTQSFLESSYMEVARIIMRDVYDDMVEIF